MNTKQGASLLESLTGLVLHLGGRVATGEVTTIEVETYYVVLHTVQSACMAWQAYINTQVLHQASEPGPEPEPPSEDGPSPFSGNGDE